MARCIGDIQIARLPEFSLMPFHPPNPPPAEDMLEKMRSCGIDSLAGTPKGHLSRVEKLLLEQAWRQAQESVRVKICIHNKGVFET